MPQRAIHEAAVVCVVYMVVVGFAASASAQISAPTAEEAQAAIAASTPHTAPPSQPEPAESPAKGKKKVPNFSGAATQPSIRADTLSANPAPLTQSVSVAPESGVAAATVGGVSPADGLPTHSVTEGAIGGTGVAPPQSVDLPAVGGTLAPQGAGTALMQIDLSGVSADVRRAPAAETAGSSSSAIRVAPQPPDARSFRESFESRYSATDIQLNIDGSADVSPGRFIVRGDLTPAAAENPAVVAAGPRAIAEAFLAEEATTFGILDLADMEEVLVETGPMGWSLVTYHRRVGGLRLEGAVMQLEIDPAGRIQIVEGKLPPVPVELYDALSQPVLSRDEVMAITSRELVAAGRDPNLAKHPYLIATSNPPYVVWKVSSSVNLVIDASTGEVLERHEGRIP
jgi:hypothetical protein